MNNFKKFFEENEDRIESISFEIFFNLEIGDGSMAFFAAE